MPGYSYFNSIKVQLKRNKTIIRCATAKFQFHKGTIKTGIAGTGLGLGIAFQFHKGTIKTRVLLQVLHLLTNFNSIKVQLKPHATCFSEPSSSFQFHKGTIKTCVRLLIWLSIHDFNSIKVQLKQRSTTCNGRVLQYFNSIKVQLKPILTQTKMSLYTMGFRMQRYKKYF